MKIITVTFILGGIFLLSAEPTFAQGFVQCGIADKDGNIANQCDFCDLLDMANSIIMWLIGFLILVAVFMIAIAGIKLVTSGGNQSALDSAKSMLSNAVIGFVIVLAAWLIVDTLLQAVAKNGAGIWEVPEGGCGETRVPVFVASELDSSTVTEYDISDTFGENYAPVAISPAGSICFNGPDGLPNSFDDVCLKADTVSGSDYEIPPGAPTGYVSPTLFIGPEAMEENPRISTSFRLCDITNCNASQRTGDYIYINPAAVAQLELINADLGGDAIIVSGYRSPAYNAALRAKNPNAAQFSRHMYGDAFDIDIIGDNTEANIVASCEKRGGKAFTYDSKSHVHCDFRNM